MLGAAGGVGSLLVQLAVDAGIAVIGVAGPGQQDSVRALGAIPVDYRAEDVPARVRELAPGGVAAVFDHVGGDRHRGVLADAGPRRDARLLRQRRDEGRPRQRRGSPC